jgi:hypothetical protein
VPKCASIVRTFLLKKKEILNAVKKNAFVTDPDVEEGGRTDVITFAVYI